MGSQALELQGVQDFLGVAYHLDVLEDFFDLAFLVNDEGGPENAVKLRPEQHFFAISAIFRGDFGIGIGQEGKFQLQLFAEALVAHFIVGAHAENESALRFNLIDILVEIPDDRSIAEAYSRGVMACEALPDYRQVFESLLGEIGSMVG